MYILFDHYAIITLNQLKYSYEFFKKTVVLQFFLENNNNKTPRLRITNHVLLVIDCESELNICCSIYLETFLSFHVWLYLFMLSFCPLYRCET